MTESDSPEEPPSRIFWKRRNLLLGIIKQNDLSQLHQYIASYPPEDILAPADTYSDDTLVVGATHGSPETLRALLKVYAAAPEVVNRFDLHKLSLLHDACSAANIYIVRFLLDSHNSQDSQSPLETVNLHARDEVGKTPILEAAASLMYLHHDADEAEENEGANRNEWVWDRTARGEQLIHFLLDRGCLATDVIPPVLNHNAANNGQPGWSVLGLAVSRAGGRLVQRIIDHGADVYLKHHHFHDYVASSHFRAGGFHTHNATTLHMACLFWNFEVVKLLLDHLNHQSNVKINTGLDLGLCRDNNGRLPLHWAAGGPGISECRLLDEDISFRITETFRLLLEHIPTSIDLPDDTGSTPLHYVAGAHAACGGSKHSELAIRTLLEHGADLSVPDGRGRTVLHIFGYCTLGSDPIGTGILELLVTHGIKIDHADQNGNTALHLMAQNLCQISTTRFLLDHEADIRATNAKGETPFHAAARGTIIGRAHKDGTFDKLTTGHMIKAQDDTMRVWKRRLGGIPP
jgi:ankyrin repeat protein